MPPRCHGKHANARDTSLEQSLRVIPGENLPGAWPLQLLPSRSKPRTVARPRFYLRIDNIAKLQRAVHSFVSKQALVSVGCSIKTSPHANVSKSLPLWQNVAAGSGHQVLHICSRIRGAHGGETLDQGAELPLKRKTVLTLASYVSRAHARAR